MVVLVRRRPAVRAAEAAGLGAGLEGISGESPALRQTDCHADRSCGDVLCRRGLSPAVSGEAWYGELPHQGVKEKQMSAALRLRAASGAWQNAA